MAITFDAEEITGKLDAIRLTQLPFAASRAANQLGWELKNAAWPAFARRTFKASGPPVPFTTGGGGVIGGLLYRHNRGETQIEIRLERPAPKGQDPSRYLAPTQTGGSIYVTRFTRRLKRSPDRLKRSPEIMPSSFGYAAPLLGSPGFAGQRGEKGIKSSFYKTVAGALESGETSGGYRYFSVTKRSGRLKPGVYRAQGRSELYMLFAFLDSVPTVPSIWNFEEFAERESLPILDRILPQFIEEALK